MEDFLDINTLAAVLAHFPQSHSSAKTAQEIAQDWPVGKTQGSKLKKVYRCINELGLGGPDLDWADDDATGTGSGLHEFVCKVPKPADARRGQPDRVYLDMNAIANFFMTDAIALQLLLGRRTINPALASSPAIALEAVETMARQRLEKTKGGAGTLARKIRIVTDGIDRKLAKIDPDVLRAMIEALTRKRWIEFDYVASNKQKSRKKLGPVGLVVKDGTIYLVALEGIKSTPQAALPLHRMDNVLVSPQPLHHAPFDLDAWIDKNGQLNHPQDGPERTINLELMVAPGSIWHFQERPLGDDQSITDPVVPDGWYRLTVTTRRWYTLTSFLASFGPYIKVVGPKEVLEGKDGMIAWAKGMADQYS
jgi:predicted DNA-binding transcriptional regulator YafY